jgi:iodotyrosine deiodinase
MSSTTRAFQPLPLEFDRLSEAEMHERSAEFLALMLRRRSVRHFSAEPVPREVVEDAVRVAGSAPSGANQQPWSSWSSSTRT